MSVLKKSTALFLSIVIVICSMLMNIGTVLAAERNESSSVLDNDEINDFSVPELNVTVDDENKWTNDINKLKITAPVSTEIYYKTSTDKLDDWGNYTDSDAFVWDGDESENLPQGSYYIKFWANILVNQILSMTVLKLCILCMILRALQLLKLKKQK